MKTLVGTPDPPEPENNGVATWTNPTITVVNSASSSVLSYTGTSTYVVWSL